MGLSEHWGKIVATLEEIIPVYDRVNHLISFGMDVAYRAEGVEGHIRQGDLILDAGCGLGLMSKVASDSAGTVSGLTLLDASKPMLNAAKGRLGALKPSAVMGLFESLPFRDGMFDVAMLGFAIRDAQNLSCAVIEFHRVLKSNGGRLIIVDLGKPDNRLVRWITGGYWRCFAVLLAYLAVGRAGLLFSALHTTYQRLPRNREFRRLLESRFSKVSFNMKMLGVVVIIYAERMRE